MTGLNNFMVSDLTGLSLVIWNMPLGNFVMCVVNVCVKAQKEMLLECGLDQLIRKGDDHPPAKTSKVCQE